MLPYFFTATRLHQKKNCLLCKSKQNHHYNEKHNNTSISYLHTHSGV